MDVREESLKMHRENQGKIAVVSKVGLKNGYEFSLYNRGSRALLADVAKSADVLIGVSAPGVFTPEINVFDSRIAPAVAAAVAYAAIRTGVARINMDPEDVKTRAAARIGHGNNN